MAFQGSNASILKISFILATKSLFGLRGSMLACSWHDVLVFNEIFDKTFYIPFVADITKP